MAYSRFSKHQNKKTNTQVQLLDYDCINILKQLYHTQLTSKEGLNKKEPFLNQLFKCKDKIQYEILRTNTTTWLEEHFNADSYKPDSEDVLFVSTILTFRVKRNELDFILPKLSSAISYVQASDKKHLLILFRAYVLINNQTVENLNLVKQDVECLLKENCNPIILEHVKKIQTILNIPELVNQEKLHDGGRSFNAQMGLKQTQEFFKNKDYISAYFQVEDFFISEKMSTDDLEKPEELYSVFLNITLYFFITLEANKNQELILKLLNLGITKEKLQDQIMITMESYIECNPKQDLLWPNLINSLNSMFQDEKDSNSQLKVKDILQNYFNTFNESPGLDLFKKAKELEEKKKFKVETEHLLDQIKLLTKEQEPFLPFQSTVEPQYLEYRNKSLALLEQFYLAKSEEDYLGLLTQSREIVLHFDKNQSQDGSFDLAFFIMNLSHFSFNKKVTSIMLEEGIDYCINEEIKYILIVMQTYRNLMYKEYDNYNTNTSLLSNEENWSNQVINKYQPLLQKVCLLADKKLLVTKEQNDIASNKEIISTSSQLDLIHQKLSEGKNQAAFEIAKSIAQEMSDNELYKIYLAKIYLNFSYDNCLNTKVEFWLDHLLRTIQDLLKSSKNKHNTWDQLLKYALTDIKENRRSLYFIHFLSKMFNHDSIYKKFYCVTAEGQINRLFELFKQKCEKEDVEAKKIAREEQLKNQKKNQEIRLIQNQIRKQAQRLKHQEQIKKKAENHSEVTEKETEVESEKKLTPTESTSSISQISNKQQRKKARRKEILEKRIEHKKKKKDEIPKLDNNEPIQHEPSSSSLTTENELPEEKNIFSFAKNDTIVDIPINENYENRPTPAQVAERKRKNQEINRNTKNVNYMLQNNICLEHITKLYNTDKILRQLFKTQLVLNGSFITKMGILLYHSYPTKLNQIICHDIDAYINTQSLDEYKEIIKLLNKEGFIQKTPTECIDSQTGVTINKCVKFELIIKDFKLDITVRSTSYQSYETIPITAGGGVFSEQNEFENNRIVFKDPEKNTAFSLSLLPNQEFKAACTNLSFSLIKPHPGTTLYCFRIFKLLQNTGNLFTIKKLDESLKNAEEYFINELRAKKHSITKSVYFDLMEFFNNNMVSVANAQKYINLLCKALLSRFLSDAQLVYKPEVLLFPILDKLYQAKVFSQNIDTFQQQIETLLNNIFENKLRPDIQNLSKKNNKEFIDKMVTLLSRITQIPNSEKPRVSFFTPKTSQPEQGVSTNISQFQ